MLKALGTFGQALLVLALLALAGTWVIATCLRPDPTISDVIKAGSVPIAFILAAFALKAFAAMRNL